MKQTMQEWIEEESRYCAHNYQPLPIVISKGEGVWLWDIEGKRYLDLLAAYSAISLGHSHPQLVATLTKQAKKLCVISRAFHSEPLKPFLKKLCQLSGMDMALPMNSGAEAVETAIKAARRWGYEKKGIHDNRAEIIVAANNFHGRTITIIGFSSEPSYKKHFGPFAPGFVEIPYDDVEALEQAITANTCAFLIEPIQGEAGIVIPKEGYLHACQKICRDNNVLMIVDEIQSGLGRTGKWFAFQHENVKPDGLILGKALGGGMLASSMFLARKDVMAVFNPGSHGSTFGGNPLAATIGLAVLDILEKDKLVERGQQLGDYLLKALQSIKHPFISQVRGKGMWAGIEMNTRLVSTRKFCEKLAMNGVLTKDIHDRVIRLAPALVIEKEELDFGLEQIKKTLKEME